MNSRTATILAFVVLLVGVGGFYWWDKRSNGAVEGRSRGEPAIVGDPATATGSPLADRVTVGEGALLEAGLHERRELGSAVVEELSSAIQRNELAWIVLSRAMLPIVDLQPDWSARSWEELRDSVQDCTPAALVECVADGPESLAPEVHLWLCAAAEFGNLWARELADSATLEAESVGEGQSLTVYVRDALGEPCADAEVRWIAVLGQPDLATQTSVPVVARAFVTNKHGEVHLPASAGLVHLQAWQAGQTSQVWVDHSRAGSSITLCLGAHFGVRGVVQGWQDAEGELKVTARLSHPRFEAELARVCVDATGQWALPYLPCVAEARYTFRLDSLTGVPCEAVLERPHPESEELIELDWRRGLSNVVRVLTPAEEPIAEARVALSWQTAGHETSLWSTSDGDGYVNFANCPPGEIRFYAQAEGFAAQRTLPFVSPLPEVFDFYLQAGGSVRGHCHHNGTAVENFVVHYYGNDPSRAMRVEVRETADGAFTLENLPLGGLTIFATTSKLPMGEPVTVTILPDQVSQVELQLFDVGTAFGRVVDADTGAPLSNAQAQVYITQANHPIEPWGAPVAADAQGYLHDIPVSRVGNRIDISAPGYSTEHVRRTPDAQGRLDMEVVGLRRPKSMTVRLAGRPGTDYTQYALDADGSFRLPRTSFPADGWLSFDGLSSGGIAWGIYPPGPTARIDVHTVVQTWDENQELVVRVGSDRTLIVKIVAAAGESLPAEVAIKATFRSPEGHKVVHNTIFGDSDTVTFATVTAAEAVIEVGHHSGATYAVRRVLCEPGQTTRVELPIPGIARSLRFVTSQMEPLAGVMVYLALAGDSTGYFTVFQTDADGLIHFRGIEGESARLMVILPDGGSVDNLVAFLTGDPEEIQEIVVEPTVSYRVLLCDGGVPLPRLRLGQFDPDQPTELKVDIEADEAGIARNPKCDRNEYLVRTISEGYWSPWLRVRGGAEDPQYTLEVRSIGALTIQTTRAGAPIGGIPVELTHEDYATDVEAWLQDGSLQLGLAALRTDAAGQLSLDGLPAGSYTWQARTPEGTQLQGRLRVPALDQVQLEIAIP